MSLEYNFARVCRTCLMENCNMKSIFSYEECFEQPAALSEMIMSCFTIQVVQGDGMPEQVCLTCANEVHRAFSFRKLCEKSEATLRQYMNKYMLLRENQQYSCLTREEKDLRADSEEVTDFFMPQVKLLECNEMYDAIDKHDSSDDSEIYKKKKKVKRKEHVNEVSNSKKLYKCKTCGENCAGLGNYRKHTIEVHSDKLQKCIICLKQFKSIIHLNRHMDIKHQNKNSEITETKNSFPNTVSKDFSDHITSGRAKSKTGIVKKRNLPRTCTICNKTFRFHSNLERHKLIHTGEKPYLCNVCGKGFAQLSYLKIHSFIHTGEKPYKCNMCERSFAAPGTLMTHIRTHTGERPHVCKICGKDFPQSGYLSAHIRTHTGEKPVECKVCHRRFNQSGRLIIHMRIHSGEKPYMCTECGRSFAVKGTLKKHIRTHTGERPYICSICGQAFAQSGTLATHMKVHKSK